MRLVAEDADGFGAKRDDGNGREAEGQRQERREEVNKAVGGRGRGVFLEKKLEAVGERLEEAVRAHAVRAPARLNVRDDLALKPGEISENGEHDKEQHDAFDERGKKECGHGLDALSGRELIMGQKRPREPLVKSVSCAEKTRPGGML